METLSPKKAQLRQDEGGGRCVLHQLDEAGEMELRQEPVC